MRFLTDFADQAVMLPLIAVVALMLGFLGWWRGAVAWLLAVGFSYSAVLVLKLVLNTCGPALGMPALRSPSGHTAAAAILAGGIAVVLGLSRRRVAGAAIVAAIVIAVTRLALDFHTAAETVIGGILGVIGALAFHRMAGPPPALRLGWLFAVVLVLALLLHGQHLDAEGRIHAATAYLQFCTGDRARP